MNTRFLLILLSLSFSGCSLFYSYSDNLPQRLDGWVSEKKFDTALNTIDYIKPSHKDYRLIQKKKKLIEKRMLAYEKNAIKKSTRLANQGEWVKALVLLKDVANNILDDTRVENQRKKLLSERKIVISAYERDVLYNQATYIAGKIALYAKIKKTVSVKERNQLDIEKFDDLRKETSLKLTVLSEQQYNNKKYDNSVYSINLALKLNPDVDTVKQLKTTTKRIKNATRKQKASYLKQAKILLSKLSQGYSHANLSKAKKTIVWLTKNIKGKKEYPSLIKKFNKHLSKGVKQRFEAARSLYSKGKTQEALSIWLELKELEPENAKLLSHIERAEKVLNKLEELSKKPKK